MKKFGLILLALMLTTVVAFSAELQGRDVVAGGAYMELQGTLYSENSEYYLDTGTEVYSVHLGPEWFAEEIGFAPENSGYANVRGFVQERDVSPADIDTGGEIFSFRTEDGRPLWAGRGNRRNQATGNGLGREAGTGRK